MPDGGQMSVAVLLLETHDSTTNPVAR